MKIQFQKKKKIKEFEIVIKNKNSNKINLRRNNSNILRLNLIPNIKKPSNNEPYLKPKFLKKNKNSFSIKNKKKNNNHNIINNINTINNDDVKNIYLNFFKVYYDENGKKVKIIKNKSNYKENKSKEIILTQKNKNIIRNKNINNVLHARNNKLKIVCSTEIFEKKINNNNDNNNNTIKTKCLSPETPTQSTTIDNKSNEKMSIKYTLGKDIINNINKRIEMLKKNSSILNINKSNNFIKKNIYYDNLPMFLQKRYNQKKNDKKNIKKIIENKNNIDNNNENKKRASFREDSLKKLKSELVNQEKEKEKEILITKLNNKFNNNNNSNNDRRIFLNHVRKNHSKIDNIENQKINYFHNDISNLTLNMTFEQKNITNTINNTIHNDNHNIKNIYISSFKKKKIRKDNLTLFPLLLDNDFDKGNITNQTLNSRHTVDDCLLFKFFKEDNNQELNRNQSFAYKKTNNYNLGTTFDNGKSNLHRQSNSFNNIGCVKRFNNSNDLFGNDSEISILNKTKEILRIKEDDLNSNNHIKRNTVFENSQPFINSIFPKSIIKNKKKNVKKDYKINQKKINISPNIDYYQDSKTINKDNQQNSLAYINTLSKNRRPCSLYINKKVVNKEKRKKNNCILNNYCNNAINKDTHLNADINNIFDNNNQNLDKNSNFQYKKIYNNQEKERESSILDKEEEIKTNLYDKKFVNINQNCTTQSLINKRIKLNNIFKYNRNRNKYPEQYLSSNSSLNSIPSCIIINKNKNHFINNE